MEKTRQQLFELAWSEPMTKLAKKFGLSDVGLRKICIKNRIPLPPQGHWTRKQFGKEGPTPELPDQEFNPVIEISNDVKAHFNREVSEAKKAAKKLVTNVSASEIRQPNQLKHERCIVVYEAIKKFIAEMEQKQHLIKFESIKDKPPSFPPTHIFSFAYFTAPRNGFPLYATARNAIRAACIADVIFERLEEKGIQIEFKFDDRNGSSMSATKEGERLEFHFREPYTKVPRTPALSRLEKQLHNYAWGSEKVEVPKNVLCLNFGWRSYSDKIFKDSGVKLEFQIDQIIEHVDRKLHEKIEDTKQEEIRQKEYERKKYIREFNQRIVQDQKQQLEHALKESKALASLVRVKLYLKTMSEIFSKLPEKEKAAGIAWVALVKKELHKIHPIQSRLCRIKRAAKKYTQRTTEYWYADLLPEDHDPDFEEEYAFEIENGYYIDS